jgi:hypothetical protein
MKRTCQALCISLTSLWGPSAWAGELSEWIEAESNGNVGSFGAYYADFSLTLSPYARYYESGLKFRFTASESLYTYPGDAAKTFISKGQDTQTDFLLGYGFQFDRWSLLLLGGHVVGTKARRFSALVGNNQDRWKGSRFDLCKSNRSNDVLCAEFLRKPDQCIFHTSEVRRGDPPRGVYRSRGGVFGPRRNGRF